MGPSHAEPLDLASPARYFPLGTGKYDVAPNLRPLGTDYGNGAADGQVFQLDLRFSEYRENTLRARAERLSKYVLRQDYSPATAGAVARRLVKQLLREHPALFHAEPETEGGCALHCRLTGETLRFDPEMRLVKVEGAEAAIPPYQDAFDALCCQVQEDLAVVSTSSERGDWLSALHVCTPSHWVPEEKIGRDFRAVHEPVPAFAPVNRAAPALVEAMVRRGPYVRFVWSVTTDSRLNRHPEPPPGVTPEAWDRPPFDPAAATPFYLRVERQVLVGLPEAHAALFAIRLYLTDGRQIREDPRERALLLSGLRSMSPEARRYKGLEGWTEQLLAWLEAV